MAMLKFREVFAIIILSNKKVGDSGVWLAGALLQRDYLPKMAPQKGTFSVVITVLCFSTW
jgi:hypothetical protein